MISSILKRFSSRKKREKIVAERLSIDLHSHLIPSIDDGAQTMQESLLLLKEFEDLGYKKVITTPHIMTDVYRNSNQSIKAGLEELRVAAKESGIKVQIDAAAEYYLDEGFLNHLHSGEILSIEGEYILFETSYVSKPMKMESMIFEIASAGYRPLLAHPERYRYVKDLKKEYGRWREIGVSFQVNLNSLTGQYGESAREKAQFLSKAGMIDFLGSDAHNKKHVKNLKSVFESQEYAKVFEKNKIKNQELL